MDKLATAYIGFSKVEQADDGKVYVYGPASDPAVDIDQQRCDPNWLKEALPDWYENWANVREMHQPSAVGVAVEYNPETHDMRAKIVDQAAAEKCVEGVYKGFSIGIKAPVVVADPEGIAKRGVIKGGKIVEVSIVDHPANENTKFVLAKGADIDAALAAQADATKAAEDQPAAESGATGESEAGRAVMAKEILDRIKELLRLEVTEENGKPWVMELLCDAMDHISSVLWCEADDAVRASLGLAADVDLAKVGAEFSNKNKAALQTLHDAITKMAPDVCKGGKGGENVEKQAIIELIRTEVPELLKAATPDAGTEALTEKVGSLEAEVAKVAGLEADVTTLKEQVEEIGKRATPGGPYVGGALPRPQEAQTDTAAEAMRAEMTKLAESEKPDVRANAQEWLRLHPAS